MRNAIYAYSLWSLGSLKPRKMSQSEISKRLQNVLEKISIASSKRPKELQNVTPKLVAVSKTKPLELIFAAYELGQRHFGENYIQELIDKSNDDKILSECKDIRWHFIGHLQSNKVPKLTKITNLHMVETIDSEKLASVINKSWGKLNETDECLQVMVQVNTSGETEKSGIPPSEATQLVKFVIEKCENLKFAGLMTIGQFGYDCSKGPNPDFVLSACRDEVSKTLGLSKENIGLSMGMSDDYEHAIELGSTNVRVGSSIFGDREKKPPAESPTDDIKSS